MTKSLNQAFIKAYSKEERSAKQTHSDPQAEALLNESFIVRFDTATVAIEPPHQPKTPERESSPPQRRVPRASVEQEARIPNAPGPVPAPKLRSVESNVNVRHAEVIYADSPSTAPSVIPEELPNLDTSEALRESIASQMLQAGTWEFPDASTEAVAPRPMGNAPACTSAGQVAQYHVEASRQQVETSRPAATPAPERSVPAEREAPPAAEHFSAPETRPTKTVQRRVDAMELASATPLTTQPQNAEAQKAGAATEAPQLKPLAEPALPQHSKRHEQDGEIFRLDRPTYDASLNQEDSGEVSAVKDSHSLTSVDVAEATARAAEEATIREAEARRKATEAEQQLRQAKKRIFNPVWEVDSLHWPAVCGQLLQQSSEQMDAVAANLASACEEGLQVLAVTSPQGGEGRTTIACCLAMLAGSRGIKVAVIDADLENPTMALQTNLELEQDWRTALENQLPLEEVSVHSIDDQVTLIPLVAPVAHNEMSGDDDRIASMFHELSESFDLVIADMGQMSSPRNLVSTMGEHGIISAVVAVVNPAETPAEQIEACVRRVRQAGIVSIGLVENFVA